MNIDIRKIPAEMKNLLNRRNVLFFFSLIIAFLMSYAPIRALYSSEKSEYYSHIALIPLVSLYLLFLIRKEIFETEKYSFVAGISVLIAGVLFYCAGLICGNVLDKNDFSSLILLAVFISVHGAFILFYGLKSYRVALFPLLFLIFIVPIPTIIMDNIISFLQAGSTEFTNLLFMATGIPFMRDGFVFHLPNLSVEVAKQCSGIRSALAIFITAILAGYLFLKTKWKIVFLVFCAVGIAMLKNGIRIVTLSLLGNYVDPRILQSSLHREGGVPFFIVALLLLAPILFFLKRTENVRMKIKDKD